MSVSFMQWRSISFILILLLSFTSEVWSAEKYSRSDFPADFVFGAGTSAYQVEGAAKEDGRTPSIWDTFAYEGLSGGGNGDVASDEYHKYKEDVKLMAETGLEAYRFSISWSRLIPNGRGPINPKGLQYYNNLINELLSHGIQPHVTLHHSDLPQALEDEYGGWTNRSIIKDFLAYADVCFREFGDRVPYWVTVNEANVFSLGGYDQGNSPPSRCSPPFGIRNCPQGNSEREPYKVIHNILLGHAKAAKMYRTKYQKYNGSIGLTVYMYEFYPATDTDKDMIATKRAFDFIVGWILDPVTYGDYPSSMKENVGGRLPSFTKSESEMVKGSCDFIGVIYYQSIHIKENVASLMINHRDPLADMAADIIYTSALVSDEEYIVTPGALQGLLEKLKILYGNPTMFIYENGQRTNPNTSINDMTRVNFMHGCIGAVLDAVRNGTNVKGYIYWSFMDIFELLNGYKSSFGLYYVNPNDPELRRIPKLSAQWYSRFLKGNSVSKVGTLQLKDLSAITVAHLFE